ncbi:MAG: hypothetical protein AAGA70_13420 [Pseudomonadota bacterium]
MTRYPPQDLAPFLHWFRERTEAVWASHVPHAREEHQLIADIEGWDIQTGTKWAPLSDGQIAAIEAREGRPFPEAYCLYLGILGGLDRPEIQFGFGPGASGAARAQRGVDWTDAASVAARRRAITHDILFEVDNGRWHPAFGPSPESREDRIAQIGTMIGLAPAVLPIIGHGFVLSLDRADPLPVLSAENGDVVLYAHSIRELLLRDWGHWIGIDHHEVRPAEFEDVPGAYGFWRDAMQRQTFAPTQTQRMTAWQLGRLWV